MLDFWIPTFKYQYVEWLEKHYPYEINQPNIKINWKRFPLKQLKAIYIDYRKNKLGR